MYYLGVLYWHYIPVFPTKTSKLKELCRLCFRLESVVIEGLGWEVVA